MILSYFRPSRPGGLHYFPSGFIQAHAGGVGSVIPPVIGTIVVMRMPPLVHPNLRYALYTHWPSRCTIQLVAHSQSVARQQIPIGASNITGLINIQCRLGPIIFDRPTDNEIRGQVTEQYVRRHLKLNGYFPQIVPRTHRVVVDGVTYQIRGVEEDSEHFSTRLMLETLRPHG